MTRVLETFRQQWTNPSDILSLLLLVGGDIVQKATAQLIGTKINLPGNYTLSIAPVAFSFGWVAYGFSSLLSAVGEMTLMPSGEYSALLINCSNGFARETHAWILCRLLRNHVTRYPIDTRHHDEVGSGECIRIDIFELGSASSCDLDIVWWLGWAVIVFQMAVAAIPWAVFGDWAPFLVVSCGNLLSAVTCSLPQWTEEKWAGRRLEHDKLTCLTRGNGHRHIMVFIGSKGSWDFERMATGWSNPRPETRWIAILLAILWTCLLITVSGLEEHTWFLVLIGSVGIFQNILAAGASRPPEASGIILAPFRRMPTIIGTRQPYLDEEDANVDLEEDFRQLSSLSTWVSNIPEVFAQTAQDNTTQTTAVAMPVWLVSMSKKDGVPTWLEPVKSEERNSPQGKEHITYAKGTIGALVELEKWVPTAGLAMLPIFFPASLKYDDEAIRGNIYKRFWKRAHHTKDLRQKADEKRRYEILRDHYDK